MNMNNDRLTYKIFEYDLQNISNDNWSGELEKILDDLNMQESLLLRQTVDLKAEEEKFNITSDLEWQDSLGWKSKLRPYTKYKLHMECENYLTLNISKYERSMLFAKLRSGTLPLYIEKGRYEGNKLERRTCPICKTNEVEDEIHFVINCNGYTTKRTCFFSYICNSVSNIFMNLDSEEKFFQLMTLENASLKRFAKFLVDIWEHRKNILLTE